ncbi:MAG: prolyl oligopeptidase family serine peptidase [Clostridia bacterium]|nr:prolyl oligopeptidase family serine peptidase [Clostridia bacterium]
MSTQSTWRGFPREDFEFEGHQCILVHPHEARPGRPWVWRAEFFDAFAQVDEAMARAGYFIAYVRLSDRYGCPSAVEDMEAFRRMLVEKYQLRDRPHIFGFSRGGLYSVNYALTYPEHTGRLYLDAPVLDIRSWPGGQGKGDGDEKCWRECLTCWGLTEETAKTFARNPLDRAEELAKLHIPVVLVAGGADTAVPFDENGLPFAARFRRAGGQIQVIVKPACGHHPHSLEDPSPIVAFLTKED